MYLVPFTEEIVFPIYRENAMCTQKITWMPFMGGGGRGTTAVMPFTGITILYPLCYRENYVLGALSEKTVYVVLYQRKLGGMVSASSSKKDVLGLSEGNNRVLLMKSMGDIDREEVFDPTVFTE